MNKKKILICDDDEDILDMLGLILEDTEYETILEQNSLNVNHIVNTNLPDLIILDLWMPVLSGDQVLRNLRNQQHTKALPVIVISASKEGKKIAEESGANDFLAKPFDFDDLIKKISYYLN
ncbi:response regulator [Pedobacter sp. AW1-32]|uniref:response regulator n=1 Tax=Pedobacter sp. AW1-32 TaxID=3383026 RepID=UPI003FEF7F0A